MMDNREKDPEEDPRRPYQREAYQPHHGHTRSTSARLAYHHHPEDPQEATPPGPRFG